MSRTIRKSEEVIKAYIEDGYTLAGTFDNDKEVEDLRVSLKSNGYDARWWRLKKDEGTVYVIYAKKRPERKLAVKMVGVDIQANFEKMTVKELKSYCQKKSITGYSKMTKAQMIDALRAC